MVSGRVTTERLALEATAPGLADDVQDISGVMEWHGVFWDVLGYLGGMDAIFHYISHRYIDTSHLLPKQFQVVIFYVFFLN